MSKVLKELVDYTQYHFTFEEGLQEKIGYVGIVAHKATHQFFIKEVEFQIKKLATDNKSGLLNFYNYLASWIFNHIAKADKIWATFMKSK